MTGKTHLIFGAAVSAVLYTSGFCGPGESGAALIGGVMIGSLLPDIDSPNSKIRNIIRRMLLPKSIRKHAARLASSGSSFHHRQALTHWPVFWLIVFAILSLPMPPILQFLFIGLLIGAETHILCDMFNPYGIMLLAPLSQKKFRLARIQTNSVGEIMFLVISIVAAFLCFSILKL